MGVPQAGWYRDPTGSDNLRYFDGSDWTDQVRSAPSSDAAAATTSRSTFMGMGPAPATPVQDGSGSGHIMAGSLPGVRSRPSFRRGIDLGLSGSVTLLDLLIHVVLRWLFVGVAVVIALIPVQILLSMMASRSYNNTPYMIPSLGVALIPFIAAFASLCRPVRTGSAEFSRLLDGRAGSGDSVRTKVRDQITRRRSPISELDAKRVSTGAAQTNHDLMLIRHRKLEIWIIAMDSGTDLWVGWTAWVRQYPIVMPFTYIRQLLNHLLGKGSVFHEAIRQSEVRAVLFAVHHSVIDVIDDVIDDGPQAMSPRPTPTVTTNGSTAATPPVLAGSTPDWWAGD